MPTIFKNRVSFDLRIYGDCKKHIARHRRLSIFENLVESVIADGIAPNEMEQHDKMFQPENIHEETFWKSCREIAKTDRKFLLNSIENGKKGGRPAQQKPVEQPKEPEKTIPVSQPSLKQPVAIEENKAKAHNMLEIVGNAYKATDAVVGVFDYNGIQREGIKIKNPRLMAFIRQRFDKNVLNKVSDWAIDHNQRGHTYNATALLKLLCKFQSDIEPTINYNHVQSEYLTFNYKGEKK